MKVIELVEKVRNNELVPQHIRYSDEDLYFDGYTYYDEEGNNDILDFLAMHNSSLESLFDEVEIIEEDKNIEKIKILNCDDYVKKGNYETILTMQEITLDIQTLKNKINEIIDYIQEKEQC